jgi:hypothetical protein
MPLLFFSLHSWIFFHFFFGGVSRLFLFILFQLSSLFLFVFNFYVFFYLNLYFLQNYC